MFRTVQVHSGSGTCTRYYAGGWRPFVQDMQLLPGSYTFRCSTGSDRTFVIAAGTVNHIQ
jgi:hypothetical protein